MLKAKLFLSFLLILLLNAVFSRPVFAGPQDYRRCPSSVDCVIGEYVFDNSGTPITAPICKIDIRNPSGDLIVDDAAMTPNPDGWHYYTANIASPEGFYRALMTCNNSGDIGYLDKSFYLGTTLDNVNTSVWDYSSDLGTTLVANLGKAIWEYSTRTLSSFGTLIADVWSYTTRTLTESALSAADVWNYATRTLTGANLSSGQLATKTNVDEATASAVLSIKTLNDYDLGDIVGYVDTLETNIGTSSDTASSSTVFGKIKKVQDQVDQLSTIDTNIDTLVSKWGSYSASDIYDKVKNLSADISAINTVSNVSSILTLSQTNETNIKEIKNKVLALKAVVDVNRALLEKVSNQPVIKTWLEEGSIIFKTLITNPSSVASQTVPLKYYLPRELKKENIIKMDEELKVDYDTSQEAYYVSDEFELAPKETKIITVEVEDIWIISEDEVTSLRKQAEELLKPLKGTSYFAQGTLVKSDIDVSLDKILRIQKEATTPQGRIRAYREAEAEMQIVEEKLDTMKTLVASAGSLGTMFGFIGGVQTLAVWGLIIVLVAGFVFLALYIRTLRIKEKQVEKGIKETASIDFWEPIKNIKKQLLKIKSNKKIVKIGIIVLFVAGGIFLTVKMVRHFRKLPTEQYQPDAKQEEAVPNPSPTIEPTRTPIEKKVKVLENNVNYLNVREGPGAEFDKIAKVNVGEEFVELERKENEKGEEWVKISLEGIEGLPSEALAKEGWVLEKYVEAVQDEVSQESGEKSKPDEIQLSEEKQVLGEAKSLESKVRVIVSEGVNGVNVREKPSLDSEVLTHFWATKEVNKLGEEKGWVKIEIEVEKDGVKYSEGWVSEQLVERIEE